MTEPTHRTPDAPHDTLVATPPPDEPVGALIHRLSEQVPELVRSELRLAQAELTEKGKKAGIGVGLFSAAGLLAFLGLATLIATAILALALVLPAWAAALVVAVVLLAGAGVAALVGKKEVSAATPPTPERTIENVREDVATVKGRHA
ncbi:MAG: phage holin family protein [Nocardioides sp.]